MSKVTELLNSPLGKKFNITEEDIQRAKSLLDGKTAAISDGKIAIAMLFAMLLTGALGSHEYNKIKNLEPNNKVVQEMVSKGNHDPDIIKGLLKKLDYGASVVNDFDIALLNVAKQLEIKDPKWLKNVILYESRNSPTVKNPVSSARGLIQFVDETSKGLGYSSSKDLVKKHSTAVSQLYGPVYKYLSKYKPFPTEQSLYMAIFRPADMYEKPTKVFPKKVRKYNPGIVTVQDYVNKVRSTGNKALALRVATAWLSRTV